MGGVFQEANRVHCAGESSLKALSLGNTAFWQDVNRAREDVLASKVTVDGAVAFVLEGGPLVRSQQEQLVACLSKIATRQCPLYKPKDTSSDK